MGRAARPKNIGELGGTARGPTGAGGGGVMRAFLAAVLSVIAVGVLLIAYGVFNPRIAAADAYPYARPMTASERVGYVDAYGNPYGNPYDNAYAGSVRAPMPYAVNEVRTVPAYQTYTAPAPRRVAYTMPATRTTSRPVTRVGRPR